MIDDIDGCYWPEGSEAAKRCQCAYHSKRAHAMTHITETITFHFENEEQQKRFHARLGDEVDMFAWESCTAQKTKASPRKRAGLDSLSKAGESPPQT